MAISWNEIKTRSTRFSREWADASSEQADRQTFWNDFFDVFGVSRKRMARFEHAVKKINNQQGFIDLLWPGQMLVEHKTRGHNLDSAYTQANEYLDGLSDAELPRFILVSDFARFRLTNTETGEEIEFGLAELTKNIRRFDFMTGYRVQTLPPESPVNARAAEKLARLHDALAADNYFGHQLDVLMVRLLFCLFADDAGIFEVNSFFDFINDRTDADGSDLGAQLGNLFDVLDTPEPHRQGSLDEHLKIFPYVGGSLFKDRPRIPNFNADMRQQLLSCARMDWSQISPAVFGSIFQSVKDAKSRRKLGAHYTSETNILKVVKSLFLDELWVEFEKARRSRVKLLAFHEKLSTLTFLDPACGCGNFLVVTYREIRLLELEIIKTLHPSDAERLFADDSSWFIKCNVGQMYGLEYEEFPTLISRTALWLVDHQMNQLFATEYSVSPARLPLTGGAHIEQTDALIFDWDRLIVPTKLSYILGNPPFSGSKMMSDEQRATLVALFPKNTNAGILDYVAGWYAKATAYIRGTDIAVAFVSTNSITQGEQVDPLWNYLLEQGVQINFAHRTFRWSNDARGNAGVYCVIIGFSLVDQPNKTIYEYESVGGEPQAVKAKNINPYLVDGPDVIIVRRSKPLFDAPAMQFGNMPLDGGNLLLTEQEKESLVAEYAGLSRYIRRLVGAQELIHGVKRYCLWLVDCPPELVRTMPEVLERIEAVRQFRLASRAPSTQKFAATPSLFRDHNTPQSYILVPRHSSESRNYIPFGFFDERVIAADSCLIIANATGYHFAILQSAMHMAWVRAVCGRLKSDYRYSKDLVYNNFPWPQPPNAAITKKLETAAQTVLNARAAHPGATLADLYDPRSMPSDLAAAHATLDRLVDRLYRPQAFASESERLQLLFEKYEEQVNN